MSKLRQPKIDEADGDHRGTNNDPDRIDDHHGCGGDDRRRRSLVGFAKEHGPAERATKPTIAREQRPPDIEIDQQKCHADQQQSNEIDDR